VRHGSKPWSLAAIIETLHDYNHHVTTEQKMQSLSRKYQQLVSSVPDRKLRKYFRLRTLSNLIYHLPDIKSNDQDWIVESIGKYIDEFQKSLSEMSPEKSVQLYLVHLKKATSYYDRYLGFAYFTPQVIIFLYALLVLGLSIFTKFFFALSMGLLAAIILITYYYKKHTQKKLYGTFY
jgi:hypothetical protein